MKIITNVGLLNRKWLYIFYYFISIYESLLLSDFLKKFKSNFFLFKYFEIFFFFFFFFFFFLDFFYFDFNSLFFFIDSFLLIILRIINCEYLSFNKYAKIPPISINKMEIINLSISKNINSEYTKNMNPNKIIKEMYNFLYSFSVDFV